MTMKKFLTAAAITLGVTIALANQAANAQAPTRFVQHHTTVSCTNRQTATWTIVNSEADKSMTFTTDRNHTGSIPAGGSTTVQYAGFSLTVFGNWSNGQTNTNTGSGNCVPDQPTTTTAAPTTTTTTEAPPSTTTTAPTSTTSSPDESQPPTVPPSTSATTPTTIPTTTAPPSTTSTVATQPSIVVDIITPPCTEPQRAEDGTPAPCGYWSEVTPTAPPLPELQSELPETGSEHAPYFALLGGGLLIIGSRLRKLVQR